MKTIDDYILATSPNVGQRLQLLRAQIKEAAPEATEDIKWGMPTFVLHGNLVHFAAHKNHIGFYPGPSCIEYFKPELGELTYSKGAVQFPHESEIPSDLVKKMVQFCVQQKLAKQDVKRSKKKQ